MAETPGTTPAIQSGQSDPVATPEGKGATLDAPDKDNEARLRDRWGRDAKRKYTEDFTTKHGMSPEQMAEKLAELAASAEAGQSEAQKAVARIEKLEKEREKYANEAKTHRAQLDDIKLETPIRKAVAALSPRQPHYADIIVAAAKSRTKLTADGQIDVLDEKGQVDPDRDVPKLVAEIAKAYPDLVQMQAPGTGSGFGIPTAGGGPPKPNGARLTEAEERALLAGTSLLGR